MNSERLRYQVAILKARFDGFEGLAQAFLELYRQAFPTDFPENNE